MYQIAMVFMALPWGMRPLLAALSDKFTIYGWLKRYQAIAVACIGGIAAFCLFFTATIHQTIAAMTVMSFAVMVIDMLQEGEYASIMAHGGGSKDMPAFAWGCTMAGVTVVAAILGITGDSGQAHYALASTFLCFFQIIPVYIYRPIDIFPYGKRYIKLNKEIQENLISNTSRAKPITMGEWALTVSIFIITIILFMTFAVQKAFPWAAFSVAFVLSFFPLALACAEYYKTHAWFLGLCIMSFLSEMLYVNIQGATDYWFTARSSCVYNGPAFSLGFYLSVSALIAGLVGTSTAAAYKSTFGRLTFRTSLQITVVLSVISSIADIIMAKRLNAKGTDGLLFILGDTALYPASTIARTISLQTLAAQYIIKGKETTMSAVMHGFLSMGQIVSKILGLALMQEFEISTTPPDCDFTFYPWLIVFAHTCIPLLTICFAFLFIPDVRVYTAPHTQPTEKHD